MRTVERVPCPHRLTRPLANRNSRVLKTVAATQPATDATVFRRGGAMRRKLRHGSPRTERGEAMSPEPRKWFGDHRLHLSHPSAWSLPWA